MWHNLLIVIVLTLLSGTFAGLTLALFSLGLSSLEQKIRMGNEKAKRVYKLRKKGNLLLCTLLLGNTASYTAMSVFLGSITSGLIAGFTATALIFLFGEILPQAVFPRYALKISAGMFWLVWIFLILLYPVTAPIAYILDKMLGKEPAVLWNKEELKEIIKYHEDVGDGIIDKDEERIILGALSFSELRAGHIMTPGEKVFSLTPQTVLNNDTLSLIRGKGYSRIPLYNPSANKVAGILYMKDLVGLNNPEEYTAEDLIRYKDLIVVDESTLLDDLLNLLIKTKVHMAIVNDQSGEFRGIVTVEDILEEILKTELEDRKI